MSELLVLLFLIIVALLDLNGAVGKALHILKVVPLHLHFEVALKLVHLKVHVFA